MFCNECGVRNPDGSKYCRDCGFKFVRLEELRLLPSRASQSLNLEKTEVTGEESDRLRHLLDMAFWHSEAGHLSSALTACEAALKVDPFSSTALSLLGLIYEKQGNLNKAIETFEKIVAINPGSVADHEKLEHLKQGIHDRAVAPSLVDQLTPPILVRATRAYPGLPIWAAIAAGAVVLLWGIVFIWSASQPGRITPPVGTVPYEMNIASRQMQLPGQLPATSSQSVQQPQYSTQPPTGGAYSQQSPGTLDQMLSAREGVNDRRSDQVGDARGDNSATQVPSVNALQPLTVPASDVPTHVVTVNSPRLPEATHVVDVAPASSANGSGADGSSDASAADGSDGDEPAPPDSHIIVTVQSENGNSVNNNAVPLPDDSGTRSITLSENAGAALQQKGLNLSAAGNYKAAEAAYESAIAAFQQDISNGRNVEEAKRGIDACQVAVQICKQSQ